MNTTATGYLTSGYMVKFIRKDGSLGGLMTSGVNGYSVISLKVLIEDGKYPVKFSDLASAYTAIAEIETKYLAASGKTLIGMFANVQVVPYESYN
jgi:hypothetical protein